MMCKPVLRFLLFFFLVPFTANGQSYRFFGYGVYDGLCDKFSYSLNQDGNGFLWVSTSQGLCRFDGKSFDQHYEGDSLPNSIAHVSYRDSRGRLWFGYENGLLSVLVNGRFRLIDPSDDFQSRVMDIKENEDGQILVLCQQSGLMRIDEDMQISYMGDPADPESAFAGKFLNTFFILPDGHLFVGTSDGLSLYRYDPELDSYIETGTIDELAYLPVQVVVATPHRNVYWVGTDDEGLFRLEGQGFSPQDFQVQKIGEGKGLDYARVNSIVFNGPRRVWISDWGTGVHRFEVDENGRLGDGILFGEGSGMPNTYIHKVFIDEEGNQWFCSEGEGIAVLRDQAFTFLDLWETDDYGDVTALHLEDDEHWYGGRGLVAVMKPGELDSRVIFDKSKGVPDDRVSALYMTEDGDLYIGTERSGLHVLRAGSKRVRPAVVSGNSLENIVNAIDGYANMLYVATNNGVYALDLVSGKRTVYSTVNGLPHNKVNDVLVDSQGRVWVATVTSGIMTIDATEKWVIDGKPRYEFMSLLEDKEGAIWAGTGGDGVFRFSSDSLVWFNTERGLMSDYVYALSMDPEGFIWVGHRMGLSRIDPERGMVRIFRKESGFSCDIMHNAAATASDGRMYLGSSDGIIRYDAFQAREDTVAPRLSIKSVLISDEPYDPTHDIRLGYDKYRIRIEFVGINLSDPEQVRYQYRMENYQDEWSEVSSLPWAYFPVVADGNYTFMLRACDGNGNCSAEPLELNISVKIPIWKAWWFILSVVLLLLATLFTIVKIRERNQKAIQEYLQRQLDERTREVVMQKEEIEIKNRDITDSINYAQRIQASILPSIKKLHDTFSGSFVFYQPRDIVSGDFYWYEKTDDNKFIIVCADSTGHGVPGAFMSMIGTTLIKDICLRSSLSSPAEMLTTLDNEVREALNQNVETDGSNDGMDIIVAKIDLSNYRLTVSSAMRPVIIYSGGEQIYIKGNRSSIGGQLDEDRVEKEFHDQVYDLNKGDLIYMFSDGYPDQFGGPLGRKFKMVRLKNLLRDIHDKPMDEQYKLIKNNFFLWKEDLEQVDDVLFMGVKL